MDHLTTSEMSKTVLYKEYGVELSKNERDEHFLDVLVGGIALSGIKVMLTPEELSLYREFGDYYVQKLMLDICHEPSKFRNRHGMKALSEIGREIAYLDSRLNPIANQTVTDLDSFEKMMKESDPLTLAGVKVQAQDLISEVFARYFDGSESEREELRQMFQKYSSFTWAAWPREPTTTHAGLRAHFVLLSLKYPGIDPIDQTAEINNLKSTAIEHGLDIQAIFAEVAKISKGSFKDILLTTRWTPLG